MTQVFVLRHTTAWMMDVGEKYVQGITEEGRERAIEKGQAILSIIGGTNDRVSILTSSYPHTFYTGQAIAHGMGLPESHTKGSTILADYKSPHDREWLLRLVGDMTRLTCLIIITHDYCVGRVSWDLGGPRLDARKEVPELEGTHFMILTYGSIYTGVQNF